MMVEHRAFYTRIFIKMTNYSMFGILMTSLLVTFNSQELHSFSPPIPFRQHYGHRNFRHCVPSPVGLLGWSCVSPPSVSSSASSSSSSSSSVLHTSSNSNNDYENNKPQQSYRSIGEVVGGLHGGKYQFDYSSSNNSGELGSSFSGSGSRCVSIEDEEEDDDEEMPNWARRMSPPPTNSVPSDAIIKLIQVPSNANRLNGMIRTTTVSIKNEERTWEKYYAKIMPRVVVRGVVVDDTSTSKSTSPLILPDGGMSIPEYSHSQEDIPYRVSPRLGHLAPRGGASNACDASKPYSDSVTLCIYHKESTTIDMTLLDDTDTVVEWWLVAGTEEEKWYYKLKYDII